MAHDEEFRTLERAALSGDVEALRRLETWWRRAWSLEGPLAAYAAFEPGKPGLVTIVTGQIALLWVGGDSAWRVVGFEKTEAPAD